MKGHDIHADMVVIDMEKLEEALTLGVVLARRELYKRTKELEQALEEDRFSSMAFRSQWLKEGSQTLETIVNSYSVLKYRNRETLKIRNGTFTKVEIEKDPQT